MSTVLDPAGAHHQRREVPAAGEQQADAAVRQRVSRYRVRASRTAEHRSAATVSSMVALSSLQQPHRVGLQPARGRAPTGGPGRCTPPRRRPCRTRRRAGTSWRRPAVQHVVEVAADQQALVGGPVRGAQGQAGHVRQRRLQPGCCAAPRSCAPAARRAPAAAIAIPARCGELLHERGVARAGADGPGHRGRVPQQDERARPARRCREAPRPRRDRRRPPDRPDHAVAGSALRPRRVGQVVEQQRAAIASGPHSAAAPGRAGLTRRRARPTHSAPPRSPATHSIAPAASIAGPRPATACRQLGGGQLDHRPRRPARGAGTGPSRRLAAARNRDRDRSASRLSMPRVLLGRCRRRTRRPSRRAGLGGARAGRRPVDGELDLVGAAARPSCSTVHRAHRRSSSPTRWSGNRAADARRSGSGPRPGGRGRGCRCRRRRAAGRPGSSRARGRGLLDRCPAGVVDRARPCRRRAPARPSAPLPSPERPRGAAGPGASSIRLRL